MFKSGFVLESLILGDQPLGGHIQTPFVIGLDHRPLEDPSDVVVSIPDTQPVIGHVVPNAGVTSLRRIRHTFIVATLLLSHISSHINLSFTVTPPPTFSFRFLLLYLPTALYFTVTLPSLFFIYYIFTLFLFILFLYKFHIISPI